MSAIQRRTMVPDTILDWFESPLMSLRPYLAQAIRVEDYFEENQYVIRAELAGLDPDKDIEITVGNGYLHIRAERYDKTEAKHHSEFRYGSFSRTVSLPPNADEQQVSASYDKGILTVTIPITDIDKSAARKIPVTQGG